MPKSITLSAGYSDGVTAIPNTFFDEYLPRANGEFLKIYLYLLRWLSHPDHALSLSGIADIFFMTENDVTRALKYWEAEGLLRLTFDRDGTIAGICLNAVTSISSQKDTPTAPPEQRRPRRHNLQLLRRQVPVSPALRSAQPRPFQCILVPRRNCTAFRNQMTVHS